MVKGDIFLIRLQPRSGSEQQGMRPGIIVSHNSFSNAPNWKSLTIVPLTTSEGWLGKSPSTVLFSKGESGLNKKCAALAHQITTIEKSKCVGYVGACTPGKLKELEQAVKNYLDLD